MIDCEPANETKTDFDLLWTLPFKREQISNK